MVLQVMPWPVYQAMNDDDLTAIQQVPVCNSCHYGEYLRPPERVSAGEKAASLPTVDDAAFRFGQWRIGSRARARDSSQSVGGVHEGRSAFRRGSVLVRCRPREAREWSVPGYSSGLAPRRMYVSQTAPVASWWSRDGSLDPPSRERRLFLCTSCLSRARIAGREVSR